MAFPIATQGVSLQSVLDGVEAYLLVITGLEERFIIRWYYPNRPAIEGYDTFIWFRPMGSVIEPSIGPVRYGTKSNYQVELNILTRDFSDQSQRDNRRAVGHYVLKEKIINSFNGLNLFPATIATPPQNSIWLPPSPASATVPPLSVAPMTIAQIPDESKDQGEEGTLISRFVVNIPIVLSLTIAS